MKESQRKMIIDQFNKLSDDVFDLVCEEYCKYMELHRQEGTSEEEFWETCCKDCRLKEYL